MIVFLEGNPPRMSQEDSKSLVNGLFHLLINGVSLGVITHLLTFDPNHLGHPSTEINCRTRFSTLPDSVDPLRTLDFRIQRAP